MDRATLQARLRERGLADAAVRIADIAEPALRLTAARHRDSELPIGCSKLGGLPDLGDEITWPCWSDGELGFVAQIDLAEFAAFACMRDLPPSGLLSFFFDVGQRAWGYDPAHRDGWRVIHQPADRALRRRPRPAALARDEIFRACRLTGTPWFSLPHPWSIRIDRLSLPADQLRLYETYYYEEYSSTRGPLEFHHHQLCGHPEPLQNDMLLECQLASHGLDCGGPGCPDPRRTQLEAGATDWRLLLQLGSEDDAGMMWGDCGTLYFLLPDDAWRTGRFDRAWTILQCT